MTSEATEKGRKLMALYRRGVGGERVNAGRLLLAHLRAHDLTLFDLDGSLPVSQDLAELDRWRESAALLARVQSSGQSGALSAEARDEALNRLVDAPDLTPPELARLLPLIDLETLIDVRADGWAYGAGDAALAGGYRRAGRQVQPAEVLAGSGSLADRLREATLRAHFRETHPERLIRAEPGVPQHFLLGVLEAVTGHAATPDPQGARAHLDAAQLARVRALLANHGAQAERVALDAAQAFGRTLR